MLCGMVQRALPSIAQHASKHGIVPLKKYGQNFLFDSSLCDKIVRASGLNEGETILEIGPGTGGLTRSILSYSPKLLTVIETDRRCIPLLQEIASLYTNLTIIEANALELDIQPTVEKIKIISNLPYQIGSELIIKWLKSADKISSITVMLQKEVVDRMRARHGSKVYGRLSVICQLICSVEKCFDVSPSAFYPPPKVVSTIVKLIPHKILPTAKVIEKIELITKLAFSERRKMIKSSLKTLSPNLLEWLTKLGINSSSRAEELSPADYLSLVNLSITL